MAGAWGDGGNGAWGGGGAWGGIDKKSSEMDPSEAYQKLTAGVPNSSAAPPEVGGRSAARDVEIQAPLPSTTTREAELRRKELALAAKEKELKAVEDRLKASGIKLDPPSNWPICWPWIYHDISVDIPDGNPRRVVKEGYTAWWGLVVCMLWNLTCASIMLGQPVRDKIASWFLAIIYTMSGIPIAFIFWYRPLYRACKNDSAISMLGFFITFMLHIAFCVWAAIAIPFSSEYWSLAGFGAAVKAFDVNVGSGTVYFIGASLWTIEALFSFWVLKDVYFFFKGKGGVAQVQKEAALATISAAVRGDRV